MNLVQRDHDAMIGQASLFLYIDLSTTAMGRKLGFLY